MSFKFCDVIVWHENTCLFMGLFGSFASSMFQHDCIYFQDKNSSLCFVLLFFSFGGPFFKFTLLNIFGAHLMLCRFRTFSMFCHFGFQPNGAFFLFLSSFHLPYKFILLVIIRKSYYFRFRLLPLSLYPHLIFIFHPLSCDSLNSRHSFSFLHSFHSPIRLRQCSTNTRVRLCYVLIHFFSLFSILFINLCTWFIYR